MGTSLLANQNLAELVDYSFSNVSQVCQMRQSPFEGGSGGGVLFTIKKLPRLFFWREFDSIDMGGSQESVF